MKFPVSAAGVLAALIPVAATAAEPPPQYVIISFDGAHDNALWERSLKLADATGARFTYFLSCVFLLAPGDKRLYQPPGMSAGRSNVGFAASRADATARLGHVWAAHQSGHEIASHGCGHFDGKDWSRSDWQAEFGQFADIVARAWEINGLQAPAGWTSLVNGIEGFRAPYLSTGNAMFAALREAGIRYDASGVSRGPQPAEPGEPTRFALPMIPEGPRARPVIAMDYNLYVRHSGGEERPTQADAFVERTYQAFAAAFEEQHRGKRVPLQIGYHFTLMNGGAYWNALERFAQEFCTKPDVRCVSYADWLRENRAAGEAHPAAGG